MNDETVNLGNGDGPEIDVRDDEVDLRERLRFAADSLVADFSGVLSIDLAEELVFNSAERLLAAAKVTDFVPILAERAARRAVRSTGSEPEAPEPETPELETPELETPEPVESTAVSPRTPIVLPSAPPAATAPPPTAAAPPLLTVSDETVLRLRDGVDRLRGRVAEWRADLTRR